MQMGFVYFDENPFKNYRIAIAFCAIFLYNVVYLDWEAAEYG